MEMPVFTSRKLFETEFRHEFSNRIGRLVNTIRQGDYYLISDDFDSYLKAQEMVDKAYQENPTDWIKKSIHTTAMMGKFSSDRAIMNYAEEIWNIEPVKV